MRTDTYQASPAKLSEVASGPDAFRRSEVCHAQDQLTDALQWARRALALQPEDPTYWIRLGHCLCAVGRIEEGIAWLKKAETQRPDDTYLLELRLGWEHYLPGLARNHFLADYQRLGGLLSRGHVPNAHWDNTPDPHRRLRLGVLSPCFRANSLTYTFEPFLDGRDPQQIDVIAYSDDLFGGDDPVTQRLRGKFNSFRTTKGLNTAALIDLAKQDRIDVMLQIGGYVLGHRLAALAQRAAPIQVTLGSADTTGISQIDYRLSDAWYDPPGWNLPYSEITVSLPNSAICYRPILGPAQVSPLPAHTNGYPTFGAFHSHLKINTMILGLWAQILKAVPNARLLIKTPNDADTEIKQRLERDFRAAGLDAARVDVIGWQAHGDHLELYNQVDMLLDTLPFTGAIMTLEGLWMGVPTLTLSGHNFVGRMGTAIMPQAGMDAFVANSAEAYIHKAISFANQWDALATLRAGLRQTLLASPLCDAHRYGQEMTQAFRFMWHRWCRSLNVDVPNTEPESMFRAGTA